MIILEGKKIAQKVLEESHKIVVKDKLSLQLSVVQVGRLLSSRVYLGPTQRACEFVGVKFKLYEFSEAIMKEQLRRAIDMLAKNPIDSGIVIKLPLPPHLHAWEILNMIPEEKDVDVLSDKNVGKFYQGQEKILPPVVKSVAYLMEHCGVRLKGKKVVIVGSGKLVGYPLSMWFLQQEATVVVVNSQTKDISVFTRQADILVSGVGKAHLIKGTMVKQGAVVIDAGTSEAQGTIKGDIDFSSVAPKASYITPVPGGVGPLTIACLIENLVIFAQQEKIKNKQYAN